METKVITSEKYSVNWRDALKGLVVAVITAVLSTIYAAIEQGGDLADIGWGNVAKIAVTAGIGYILKNWLFEPPKTIVVTGSNDETKQLTKDIKQAVK